jgi:hypothetical protein
MATIEDNTYYIDTTLFSTATAVWTDSALTVKAADGWYQATVEDNTKYRQQTGGTLGSLTNCQCPAPCGTGINGGSLSPGSYIIDIDTGSTGADVGAIIVYFCPYNIPDGILATYNSNTYNTLTDNTNGLSPATAGELNFVGGNAVSGCTATDLEGSSNTEDEYTWNGSAFAADGTSTTINIPASGTVNLSATTNIFYTLVIPKPTATPATLRLQMVGVCSSTGFSFKAFCPAALPSFDSSTVAVDEATACADSVDQTYYFAQNSSTTGAYPQTPVADTNTTPQVGNFVYSDPNGASALSDGYYLIPSATVLQITSGVVVAITTPCSNCTSFSSSANTNFNSICAGGAPPTTPNTYYHNGAGTYPATADTVYSDSGCSTPLPAGYYYMYSAGGSNYYILVGISGFVSQSTSCTPPTTTFYMNTTNMAACNTWCDGTNRTIPVERGTTTNDSYANVTSGDQLTGTSLGAGYYAYAASSTDTATGPFRIMQIDNSNNVLGIYECIGASCTPL